MIRKFLALSSLVLLGGAVSCAPGTPDTVSLPLDTAHGSMSEFQRQAISDGEITREEYDQAFANFQSCMEDIGYPLIGVREANMLYDYSFSVEADDQGGDDCHFDEFASVNAGWSIRPEVVELSDTSKVLKTCLIDQGIAPAETHLERLEQAFEHDIDVLEDCLT